MTIYQLIENSIECFFGKTNIIKGVLGRIVKQPNGAIVPDSIVYKSFPFNHWAT